MRLLTSISLSVLLLLQTFNFGATDVLRLGDLIEHARFHSNEYGDSFVDFLTKHYGSSKKDHFASHEDHQKLPFNPDSAKFMVNIYVVDDPLTFEFASHPQLHPKVKFFYINSYTSQASQKIFQPPKYA